jgi:sulfur-carrier protein
MGPARDAAGVASADVPGASVGEVLHHARLRYGEAFASLLAVSQVCVNGEPVAPDTRVGADDEVAVLPPVSGG